MFAIYIAGISLGFLGSVHCVGMCGPIALALKLPGNNQYISVGLYHFGRILAYVTIGILVGFLGLNLKEVGVQQMVSLFLGVIILLIWLLSFFLPKTVNKQNKLVVWVQKKMMKLFQLFQETKRKRFIFSIGYLNGFLPCGFVYIAVVAAISSTSSIESILFMFGFGVGTFPALALLHSFKGLLNPQLRSKFFQLAKMSILILGILLILRGLSLGIPYVSPNLQANISSDCPCGE